MRRPLLAAVALLIAVGLVVPATASQAARGERGKPKPSPTATTTATPSPTPSPTATASPTASPSPTPTTTTTASPTPTASASSTPSPTRTADVYVTPSAGYREALLLVEGALVEIASDVTTFDAAGVAAVLRANAYQLALLGPMLKVRVQSKYGSQASTAASTTGTVYTRFAATLWLDARPSSVFSIYPHKTMAHEYGHAWSYYHFWITNQGSWSRYHAARGITGDPRLETSYLWQTDEIIADDYRFLLGSPESTANIAHLQPALPDPRTVPDLRGFLTSGWTSPV